MVNIQWEATYINTWIPEGVRITVQINETILFAYRQNTFHLMHSKISMNIIILDVQIWITKSMSAFFVVPSKLMITSLWLALFLILLTAA